jgi:D-3-phosphoglycerate dehydrogenase
MTNKTYFIIDFDSTFIQTEGLEEFAKIVLRNRKNKDRILEEINRLTRAGMEGKIDFEKSLSKRMRLLGGSRSDIEKTVAVLRKKISRSIKRNKLFFKQYRKFIYIVSGGFREFIEPVVESFYITPDHIFANRFIFDSEGKIIGYDKDNPLAKKDGKVAAVKSLRLNGEIYVIGDGYTDWQIKEIGAAKHFIAFTENVKRLAVIKKADRVVSSFDEFLYVNRLPMSFSYPKNRIKVVLLENINNLAVKLFEKEGYTVEYYQSSPSKEKLTEIVESASVLGVRSRTIIDEEIISAAKRLLAIGVYAIGVNNIDLIGAAKKGIVVFNAPYSNTRSVVELVIGEMIMLQRGILDKNKLMHQGVWQKTAVNSYELRGKTLGIIGYGNIGSQLSVLAENLGLTVYYYDIVDRLALGNAKKCRHLSELLAKSDIITVHVDGRDTNKNLIGKEEFAKMKDGVIFLNLSRGFVVDLDALKAAILSGKVRGAAIDVFPVEPKSNQEKFSCELQNLPNVILTPHIGGSTQEAQKNIAQFVNEKIIDYINSGNSYLSVNFPQIKLTKTKSSHRLLHIHENVPGILANINGVLARNKINILGQYLKTNEQIGYAITDVDKKYDHLVLQQLKKIPQTIRFRVLY